MASPVFNLRYRELRERFSESFHSADIWAQPTLPEEEEKVVSIKLANDFLVGCDPEFCVLQPDGKVLDVQNVLPHDGEVGYDHGGLEAELRPKPAKGTYALLKRLRILILQHEKLNKLATYRWRAGAAVQTPGRLLTMGGHVHFGLLPRGEDVTDRDGAKFDMRLKALDRTTKYLEALDILPRDESALRREKGDKANPNQQYGKWSDIRICDPDRHIEYRTMASWLFDPTPAYIALTAAKLAAAAPQLTLDTLKANNFSYVNFVNFFEVFRHKDTNAKRALEKLIDGHEVKVLQLPPDANFRASWEKLPL